MIKMLIAVAALATIYSIPVNAKMVCEDGPMLPSQQGMVASKSCHDDGSETRGQDVEYWSPRVGKYHTNLPPKYAQWVEAYCFFYPKDADCAASGFHPTTSDPIEQAVDKRLADHRCETDKAGTVYCQSPFKHFAAHPDDN